VVEGRRDGDGIGLRFGVGGGESGNKMWNILVGVLALVWGSRTCYFGFRKAEAPELILTDDPKIGKSAHRLYGLALVICGVITIFTEVYVRW
jgi:hypothetical protein